MEETFKSGDMVASSLEPHKQMVILSKSTDYTNVYFVRYINKVTGMFVSQDFYDFELIRYRP